MTLFIIYIIPAIAGYLYFFKFLLTFDKKLYKLIFIILAAIVGITVKSINVGWIVDNYPPLLLLIMSCLQGIFMGVGAPTAYYDKLQSKYISSVYNLLIMIMIICQEAVAFKIYQHFSTIAS
jgi:hypothetical protein